MSPSLNLQHILVCHDFSETADPALAYAVSIAEKFRARITILHAYERPAYSFPESLVEDFDFETKIDRAARKALDAVAARARRGGIEIAVKLRMGTPWKEIVAAAEESRVDLVVMGTHGRRGVARALLGSVAEKVVRCAPCAVLTVHGSASVTE
jgi:nucleotide-binding universal stress UspA family protein